MWRLRRRRYDRSHPGEPWIAIGAISYLKEHLRPDMTGFEWGSGRSTAWYAARLRSLTSIEHDASWYQTVSGNLPANAALRLIPMDPSKHNGLLHTGSDAPEYVRAIDAAGPLDFVVVDGQYRLSCAVAALPTLKPGGMLLVDDILTYPQLEAGLVPPDWEIVCDAREGLSATRVWRKPGMVG